MKEKHLYIAWGALYVLCAGLGFIAEPQGLVKALMVLFSALFFLPGGILLYRARKTGDAKTCKRIRSLSLLWLGTTLMLLVANLLSALAPDWLGTALHVLLVLLTSPMLCSGYWVAVMFAWACLLMVTLKKAA